MINIYKTFHINFVRVNSIFPPVIVDVQIILPTNSVKNLSFIFDRKLSFIDLKCMSIFILQFTQNKNYYKFVT